MQSANLPPKLRNKSPAVILAVYNSASYTQIKQEVEKKEDESSSHSYSGCSGSPPMTIYKYPGIHKGWVLEEVGKELPFENQYREDREALKAAKKGDLSAIKALPPRRSKMDAKKIIHDTIEIQI